MPIAFLTLELHIEAAQSIKDRRQVVRSLKDRLRTTFNVSIAELDGAELWNRATIGVVSISHSRDYLDGLMKNVERAATRIANRQSHSFPAGRLVRLCEDQSKTFFHESGHRFSSPFSFSLSLVHQPL